MKRICLGFILLLAAISGALAVNARVYNLGDASITTAVTNSVITSSVSAQGATIAYVDRLEGASAITLSANFTWGSGGTSLKVDVETSLNQGATWIPICRFAFTTSSAEKVANVSGMTPKTTAVSPSALSDDACLDGVLGDRLRAKITTVGTYAGNTAISVRASVR
jgi:hypothetical protein